MSFQPYHDHLDTDVSPKGVPKRREVRPSTPSRQMSNPLLRQSSSPRQKTGLIFGTPRRGKSGQDSALEDPFKDPFSPTSGPESQTSPGLKRLALPARTITYPRPNEKASYGRPDCYSDEEPDTSLHARYQDEKEDLLEDEEASMISQTPLERKQSKKEYWQTARKWLTPSAVKRPHRLWLYCSGALVALLLSGLIACILFITVGLRHPEAHWKGTLSLSNGALDSTGFNFTRHVQIGLTNPNTWPVDLKSLDLAATYNSTFAFATASESKLQGITIPRLNKQNATIPIEMSFSYATAQDADSTVLKALYLDCKAAMQVPLEIRVRGAVASFGLPARHVDMGTIAGQVECGSNLVSLLQSMLSLQGQGQFLSITSVE